MKVEDKGYTESHGPHGRGAGDSEALLRAEIGFWRDLLQECSESVPADSVERMRQALALAEHRFLLLSRQAGAGGMSSDCPRAASPADCRYLH
jgi:hypothetical protein